MSEEKDKKEEKKEDPVEWGTRDEKLGAVVISRVAISEKEKDSKRKR